MTIEDNKRLARSVPEEMATDQNFDRVDEVFAEDVVEHNPLAGDVRGREAIREAFQDHLDSFPDFEATVERIVAEGDLVAMHVRWRGTHEGPFMGVEPTGETFEAENMVFTRVEDGKIAERWLLPDALGMLRQLGVDAVPTAPDQ